MAHSRCLMMIPLITCPLETLNNRGPFSRKGNRGSFIHSFIPSARGTLPLREGTWGLSYHGGESLTHCDMCQLVHPGTNEASLPPLTPCHGQSASSSLAITSGEHPPRQGGLKPWASPPSSSSNLGPGVQEAPPPSPLSALPPLPSPRLSQLGP